MPDSAKMEKIFKKKVNYSLLPVLEEYWTHNLITEKKETYLCQIENFLRDKEEIYACIGWWFMCVWFNIFG